MNFFVYIYPSVREAFDRLVVTENAKLPGIRAIKHANKQVGLGTWDGAFKEMAQDITREEVLRLKKIATKAELIEQILDVSRMEEAIA